MPGRAKALSAVLLLAAAGCATAAPQDDVQRPDANDAMSAQAAPAPAVSASPVGPLPAQALRAGECGLFLWTRREKPEFVFFSRLGGGAALMNLNGALTSFAQAGAASAQTGPSARQTYRAANGAEISLTLETGEALEGGVRVPAASISLTQKDGWDLVIPAAGLTACETG